MAKLPPEQLRRLIWVFGTPSAFLIALALWMRPHLPVAPWGSPKSILGSIGEAMAIMSIVLAFKYRSRVKESQIEESAKILKGYVAEKARSDGTRHALGNARAESTSTKWELASIDPSAFVNGEFVHNRRHTLLTVPGAKEAVEPLLEPPPTQDEIHEALMNPWPGHSTQETIKRNRENLHGSNPTGQES